MRSDSEPDEILAVFDRQRPIVESDADGPERPDLLEAQREMPRIVEQRAATPIGASARRLVSGSSTRQQFQNRGLAR